MRVISLRTVTKQLSWLVRGIILHVDARVSILAIAIINRLIIPCIRARYAAISFGQNIPKINFRFLNNHEQEECNFFA